MLFLAVAMDFVCLGQINYFEVGVIYFEDGLITHSVVNFSSDFHPNSTKI